VDIENAFVSCCILHNMLLDHDGYDDWESFIVDPGEIDGHEEDDILHQDDDLRPQSRVGTFGVQPLANRDDREGFQRRRIALIEHFVIERERNNIVYYN
jgi:hypothetical protein